MATEERARYVFAVRFRLIPRAAGVSVEPATFETTMHRRADPPGEAGWRFFRDNLWRGEAADEAHLRELAAEALGVEVEAVSFRELQTTPGYLESLEEAVRGELEVYNASSVEEVLNKYLGSSIRVVETPEW